MPSRPLTERERAAWELLLTPPAYLSDDEAALLLESEERLKRKAATFPFHMQQVQRLAAYRARRQEIEALEPTEFDALCASVATQRAERAQAAYTTGLPLDSDLNIVDLILEERSCMQSPNWEARSLLAASFTSFENLPGAPFSEGFPDTLRIARIRNSTAPVLFELLLVDGSTVHAYIDRPQANRVWVVAGNRCKTFGQEAVAAWQVVDLYLQ